MSYLDDSTLRKLGSMMPHYGGPDFQQTLFIHLFTEFLTSSTKDVRAMDWVFAGRRAYALAWMIACEFCDVSYQERDHWVQLYKEGKL